MNDFQSILKACMGQIPMVKVSSDFKNEFVLSMQSISVIRETCLGSLKCYKNDFEPRLESRQEIGYKWNNLSLKPCQLKRQFKTVKRWRQ